MNKRQPGNSGNFSILENKLRKLIREEISDDKYKIDLSIGKKYKKGKSRDFEPSRTFELGGIEFRFASGGTGGLKYSSSTVIRNRQSALLVFHKLKIGTTVEDGFILVSVGLLSYDDYSYIAVK